MSVLTQSMSCSSYKDKVNQMYLSSYSTSTSSNAIDEASKTFLLSGRKAEKRDRTLSINKALKTGNIKDIHIEKCLIIVRILESVRIKNVWDSLFIMIKRILFLT